MLEIVSLISIPTSILLFVFVISLNRRLSNQQKTYECIFLEKVKLTERCSYLSDIEKKYEDSIQKCKELEKDRIVLSSKLEQERKSFCEKINLLENAERKLPKEQRQRLPPSRGASFS